jgi:hypothetical protein
MKNFEFKKIGTVQVGSSRLVVKEYQHGGYFQIGSTKIPAKTRDEAVTRYRDSLAKKSGGQRDA